MRSSTSLHAVLQGCQRIRAQIELLDLTLITPERLETQHGLNALARVIDEAAPPMAFVMQLRAFARQLRELKELYEQNSTTGLGPISAFKKVLKETESLLDVLEVWSSRYFPIASKAIVNAR